MQEEISLREILEMMWKGKKIIILITSVAILCSGILSFFVLPPSYEAQSIVRFSHQQGKTNSTMDKGQWNSYAQSLKSDVTLKATIENLKLDESKYNIKSVRDSIQVAPANDANVINIKIKGDDPKTITQIINLLSSALASRAEITERSNIVFDAKKRLIDLGDEITIAQAELNETNKRLQNTPEKSVAKTSPVDAQQMNDEHLNPVYTALQIKLAEASINVSKLVEEKSLLENKIAENEKIITDIGQLGNEKVTSKTTERMPDGLNTVFISPALEPQVPIGPKTLVNIVIAAVVGLMASVMLVFFRHYWRDNHA